MTYPIFKGEADILASTYYHKATIIRPVHAVDEYGFDDFVDEVIYKNILCAVSFTQGSTQDITDTTQPINYIAVLFTRPDVDIRPGDLIQADVLGHRYDFKAGEGVVYQSHIEVPLIRSGEA